MFGLKRLKEKREEKRRLKKQETKNRVIKMLQWYFAILCFSSLLVYGIQIGSVLMVLVGVATLPLQPIRDVWSNVFKEKMTSKLKIIVLSVLFVLACCILPEIESDSTQLDNTQVVSEIEDTENDSQTVEAVEYETESDVADVEVETEQDVQIAAMAFRMSEESLISASDIPIYAGKDYVVLNNNIPEFSTSELTPIPFEYYSDLDSLGRCGVVYACIGQDTMPIEERDGIGQVKPTGWHTVKYDIVDGKYLYNRCHLIGYQLSAENANVKNLITGTRQMNMEGMLPFENMVADYVKETNNHVMYRVTPVYEGDNLLAKGVKMEAYSIEDDGASICFNVFVYNVQDGIEINYANGDSKLIGATESKPVAEKTQEVETKPQPAPEPQPESTPQPEPTNSGTMVWKTATGSKYHSYNSCGRTNPANATQITELEAISMGLGKCSKCW